MSPYGAPNDVPSAQPGSVALRPPGPAVPAPPPGPGVTPPFAAPPTDRDPRTIWLRVVVSGVLLLLCCAGGITGIGVVIAGTSRQLTVQAKAVVEAYLGALRSAEYRRAYDLLCETTTAQTSLESFTSREQARPVTQYQVHDVHAASELVVAASVTYRGEAAVAREYVVTAQGAQLRICGER